MLRGIAYRKKKSREPDSSCTEHLFILVSQPSMNDTQFPHGVHFTGCPLFGEHITQIGIPQIMNLLHVRNMFL